VLALALEAIQMRAVAAIGACRIEMKYRRLPSGVKVGVASY
jgi:hypothetical protein